MKNQKDFIRIVLIGGIVLLVIIAGYFIWSKKSNNLNTAEPLSTSTPIDTSNWKTYTSTQNEFEIKYPADWVLGEGIFSLTKNGYKIAIYASNSIVTGGISGIGEEKDLTSYDVINVSDNKALRNKKPHLPEEPRGGIYYFDIKLCLGIPAFRYLVKYIGINKKILLSEYRFRVNKKEYKEKQKY